MRVLRGKSQIIKKEREPEIGSIREAMRERALKALLMVLPLGMGTFRKLCIRVSLLGLLRRGSCT